MSQVDVEAIHEAATVVVLREGSGGLEVLLLQRASELAFHGGAWVFPGGRVDAHERAGRDELEAARAAAVRESFEEARLEVDAHALVPLSHWTTPRARARRFATWFFVTLHEGAADVVPDGGEIRAHRWLRPEEALALQAARELELPPPTFVTLTELARFDAARDFVDQARASAPFVFMPRPRVVPNGIVSLYGGDAAYDEPEVERDGPRHRLHMLATGWRYERTFDRSQ